MSAETKLEHSRVGQHSAEPILSKERLPAHDAATEKTKTATQEFHLRRETQEENLIAHAEMTRHTANAGLVAGATASTSAGTSHHMQGFLQEMYTATKKRAEKRGETPEFELLRQQLATIVPPESLDKLEKAMEKASGALNGLDSGTIATIENRIQGLTQNKALLDLVIKQRNGEKIEVAEKDQKEFDELLKKIPEIFAEEVKGQENRALEAYTVEVVQFLRGQKYLDQLQNAKELPDDTRSVDAQSIKLLRQHLESQLVALNIPADLASVQLEKLIGVCSQERERFVIELKTAKSNEEFLRAMERIPTTAMTQVAGLFSQTTSTKIDGKEYPQPLIEAIRERFGTNNLDRHIAEGYLRNDRGLINAARFLEAYEKGDKAIHLFLQSLPAEERHATLNRVLSSKETLGPCLTFKSRTNDLAISTTATQLLEQKLSGDSLRIAQALLDNDPVKLSAAQVHAAIERGDGASAAKVLGLAREAGIFSEMQIYYQESFGTSLGQHLHDNRDSLSTEMLLAVRAAAIGDQQGLAAAQIRSLLGFGDGARKAPEKIWEVLSGLSPAAQQELNSSFVKYLTPREQEQLRAELTSRQGKPATEAELTLKNFLSTKLSKADLALPAIYLDGKQPTAWDLLRHGIENSNGVDNTFIQQQIIGLLADPGTGAQALKEIRAGYAEMRAGYRLGSRPLPEPTEITSYYRARGSRELPENFFEAVGSRVSSETGKSLGLVLGKAHLINSSEDLKVALSNDKSGMDWMSNLITGTDSKSYDSQRTTAENLLRQYESASEADKPAIQRKLSLALGQLESQRELALNIREIGADFAAQAGGAVAGTGVILLTGGLGAPAAIALAGGVGVGSRALAYSVVAGHGPDADRWKDYAIQGGVDAISMGAMRGAGAVASRTAGAIGARTTTSTTQHIARMGAAGAAGGAVYGLSMGAVSQVQDGEFSALKLIKDAALGGALGAASGALIASLPQSAQARTGTAYRNERTKTFEHVGPEGKGKINNSTSYEQKQRQVTKELSHGRTRVEQATEQKITDTTGKNVLGGLDQARQNTNRPSERFERREREREREQKENPFYSPQTPPGWKAPFIPFSPSEPGEPAYAPRVATQSASPTVPPAPANPPPVIPPADVPPISVQMAPVQNVTVAATLPKSEQQQPSQQNVEMGYLPLGTTEEPARKNAETKPGDKLPPRRALRPQPIKGQDLPPITMPQQQRAAPAPARAQAVTPKRNSDGSGESTLSPALDSTPLASRISDMKSQDNATSQSTLSANSLAAGVATLGSLSVASATLNRVSTLQSMAAPASVGLSAATAATNAQGAKLSTASAQSAAREQSQSKAQSLQIGQGVSNAQRNSTAQGMSTAQGASTAQSASSAQRNLNTQQQGSAVAGPVLQAATTGNSLTAAEARIAPQASMQAGAVANAQSAQAAQTAQSLQEAVATAQGTSLQTAQATALTNTELQPNIQPVSRQLSDPTAGADVSPLLEGKTQPVLQPESAPVDVRQITIQELLALSPLETQTLTREEFIQRLNRAMTKTATPEEMGRNEVLAHQIEKLMEQLAQQGRLTPEIAERLGNLVIMLRGGVPQGKVARSQTEANSRANAIEVTDPRSERPDHRSVQQPWLQPEPYAITIPELLRVGPFTAHELLARTKPHMLIGLDDRTLILLLGIHSYGLVESLENRPVRDAKSEESRESKQNAQGIFASKENASQGLDAATTQKLAEARALFTAAAAASQQGKGSGDEPGNNALKSGLSATAMQRDAEALIATFNQDKQLQEQLKAQKEIKGELTAITKEALATGVTSPETREAIKDLKRQLKEIEAKAEDRREQLTEMFYRNQPAAIEPAKATPATVKPATVKQLQQPKIDLSAQNQDRAERNVPEVKATTARAAETIQQVRKHERTERESSLERFQQEHRHRLDTGAEVALPAATPPAAATAEQPVIRHSSRRGSKAERVVRGRHTKTRSGRSGRGDTVRSKAGRR